MPLPCPSLPACSRGACQASLQHPLTPARRGGRAQGSCRGAEGRDCSWGGGGSGSLGPLLGNEPGDKGLPCPVSACLVGGVLPPKLGHFFLGTSELPSVQSGWWRRSFPQMCALISQLCLPGMGQGSPWFWAGARVAPWLHPGAQAWGPGAPGLPWQGTLGVLVAQDGDRGRFTPQQMAGCPTCPWPASPPQMPLRGGWSRQGGGGNTGWSESEPGICRMSPYPDSLCFPVSISTVLLQPPAGGWQERLWEEQISLLPSLPPSLLPPGASPGL